MNFNIKNIIISLSILFLCWNLPAQVRVETLNAFTTDTQLRLEMSLSEISDIHAMASAPGPRSAQSGNAAKHHESENCKSSIYNVYVSIISCSDGSTLWEGKAGDAVLKPHTSANGSAVSASSATSAAPQEFNFTIDGLKPKLWSTVTPELYDVHIDIACSKPYSKVSAQTRVGFRHFEMKDGRFYLNGEPIFLRGNAINPPNRGIPAGLEESKEFARDYVRFLKGMNINIIRIPTNQNWLEVCDEEGMMVFGGRYGRPRNSISASQPSTDIPSSVEYYKTNELGPLTPHPSVVIYVLSNEMPYSGESGELWHRFLEDCYLELVKWDSTRAYIGNAGYGLGKEADIYDVHRYWGWYYNTFLTFLNLRDGDLWENPGKVQAITFTECVGNYTGIDGAYNLCSRTKQPGSQKCWTGHSHADEQSGEALTYQAFVLKNVVEMFRRFRPQNERLAGVMPFTIIFHNWDGVGSFAEMKPKPAAYQYGISYQPILLSWENWKYNIYAGSAQEVVMHIVNDDDCCRDLENAEVRWRLVNRRKTSVASGVEKLPAIPYYGTMSRKVTVNVPVDTPTGTYTLIGEVLKDGKTISHNSTEMFIADKSWRQECGESIARLSERAIILGNDNNGISGVTYNGKSGITYNGKSPINDNGKSPFGSTGHTVFANNAFDDITKAVIIGEDSWDSLCAQSNGSSKSQSKSAGSTRNGNSKSQSKSVGSTRNGNSKTQNKSAGNDVLNGENLGKEIATFIRKGGKVLILKQKPDFDTSWLPVKVEMLKDSNNSNEYLSPSYTYCDGMNINIERPDHEIFDGLSKSDFKLWSDCSGFDESQNGFPEIYPVTGGFSMRKADLTKASILANYSRNLSGTALCEIFDGKGSVIMSGFDIESKLGTDPIADRLYANMLSYIVSEAAANAHDKTGNAHDRTGDTYDQTGDAHAKRHVKRQNDAYATVGDEIVWGDFKSEMGIVTGANNGLILNTYPIVPEDQKDDCPIKVDSLGYQYVGSYGGWNSRPGIQYVPMGRRPFGPYEYTLGGSDKVSAEYAKEGSGYVAVRLHADKKMMETTVWNPYKKPASISVIVNGTEVSTAEIEPGETAVIKSVLPGDETSSSKSDEYKSDTSDGWKRLKIEFRGSRYAVLMKTAFLDSSDASQSAISTDNTSSSTCTAGTIASNTTGNVSTTSANTVDANSRKSNLFRGTDSVTATVTASGEKDGYPATAAFDGKYTRDSRWISSGTAPHWLEVNLDKYCDIDSLVIKSGIPADEMKENESHQKEGFWCVKNFIIQYWDDANWTDIDETYTTENRSDAVSFKLAKTVTSFRFRLKSTDGESIRIIEFEGWGKVNSSMPAPTTSSFASEDASSTVASDGSGKSGSGRCKSSKGGSAKQETADRINVRIFPEITGRTMKYVGYNQGYFVPGNNAAAWLEYSCVNAVRVWAESDTYIKDSWIDCTSKPSTEEDFLLLKNSFLKDPVNAGVIDWKSIGEQADKVVPSTNTMSLNSALDDIHSIGADILIQSGFGKNRYDSSWTNKWQIWQKYYALAFYAARRADVNMFAMKNEPNHRHAGPMPLDLFIDLSKVCSDAIHTAVNDVNRIYGKNLEPKFVGPVTAGTNTDWWAAVAANPGIFDLFSTHSYNLPAAGYEGRTAMIESVQKANSPDHTSLPVIYTEIGRWMNAYLIDKEETMDSPSLFSEWAGIYTKNMQEGAYGMWAFKFANTASSTYPKGIKSGHHYTWKGVRFAEDSFENIALDSKTYTVIGIGTGETSDTNSSKGTGAASDSASNDESGKITDASEVTDGDKSDSSAWTADSDCGKQIVVELGGERSIAGLSIYSGSSSGVFTAPDRLRNFSIDFFCDGEWNEATRIEEKANKYAHDWYLFDTPITASKVRLTIFDKGKSIVREIKVFAPFDSQLVENGCFDIAGTQRTAQVVRMFAKGFKDERPLLKTVLTETNIKSGKRSEWTDYPKGQDNDAVNGGQNTWKNDGQSDVCASIDSMTNTAYIWLVHRGKSARSFDIDLSALGITRGNRVIYETVDEKHYGDGGIISVGKNSSIKLNMAPHSVTLVTVPLGKTIEKKAAASTISTIAPTSASLIDRTSELHGSYLVNGIHKSGVQTDSAFNTGIHTFNVSKGCGAVSMNASDYSDNRITLMHFDGIGNILEQNGHAARKYVLALSAHSSDGKPYRFHIYMKPGKDISSTELSGHGGVSGDISFTELHGIDSGIKFSSESIVKTSDGADSIGEKTANKTQDIVGCTTPHITGNSWKVAGELSVSDSGYHFIDITEQIRHILQTQPEGIPPLSSSDAADDSININESSQDSNGHTQNSDTLDKGLNILLIRELREPGDDLDKGRSITVDNSKRLRPTIFIL